MKKIKLMYYGAIVAIVLMGIFTLGTAWAAGDTGAGGHAGSPGLSAPATPAGGNWAAFLAIAITMGCACLSAGYAVGKVGSAALGAAVEKPELLGKAIMFVGLGEGIAILGLVISMMLMNKI